MVRRPFGLSHMDLRWYVVEASHHCEAIALSGIEKLGVRAYLPLILVMMRDRSRHSRPLMMKERPLIPGYLFVQFDKGQRDMWSKIPYTRGVARILGGRTVDGDPDPIAIRESLWIEQLMIDQAQALQEPETKTEQPSIDVGETVRFSMAGIDYAGIVKMRAGDRYRVMMQVLDPTSLDLRDWWPLQTTRDRLERIVGQAGEVASVPLTAEHEHRSPQHGGAPDAEQTASLSPASKC